MHETSESLLAGWHIHMSAEQQRPSWGIMVHIQLHVRFLAILPRSAVALISLCTLMPVVNSIED